MTEIGPDPGLPPLLLLRAFEAAGRTGSMRRAAQDLGVSHTVVSRHVRHLEYWIGRKLVATGPRGVELTGEGEVLLAAASRGFGLIARATAELRPRREGRLSIWCMAGLATRWLTPRLTELGQTLGIADIELRATDAKPDLARREADVMIGFHALDRMPERAVPLVRPRMFPVASPGWLDRNGSPASVQDLARVPLIHEGSHLQWSNWFEALGLRPDVPLSGPRLSDARISYDAALAGQGVALANDLIASEDLRDGRVVELFVTDVELGGYYLLHARDRDADPVVRGFRTWVVAAIERSVRVR